MEPALVKDKQSEWEPGTFRTDSDGTVSYRLVEPIAHKEGVLSEVTLKKLTAGILEETDKVDGTISKTNVLIKELTGIKMVLVHQLGVQDFQNLDGQITRFMKKGKSEKP